MQASRFNQNVDTIIDAHGRSRDRLIQILLDLQDASGRNYIPAEWEDQVAARLDLPVSNVHDVVTFYEMFSSEPRGKYVIEICSSGPCLVNKPQNMIAAFERILGIKMGSTTEDGLFTLTYASCFGGCEVSPAVKISSEIYGNLDDEKIARLIAQYREA